jgi:hypothetical protein
LTAYMKNRKTLGKKSPEDKRRQYRTGGKESARGQRNEKRGTSQRREGGVLTSFIQIEHGLLLARRLSSDF